MTDTLTGNAIPDAAIEETVNESLPRLQLVEKDPTPLSPPPLPEPTREFDIVIGHNPRVNIHGGQLSRGGAVHRYFYAELPESTDWEAAKATAIQGALSMLEQAVAILKANL